jgi:hypothetical protein
VTKLNQIVAIASGKKSRAEAGITAIHHKLQKAALLDGISRVYKPKDEEGERLPSESKHVQLRVSEVIAEAKGIWSGVINVIATQDNANQDAIGDIMVDGKLLVVSVPITHLLYLEKQLIDLHTFIEKLPVLDPAEQWVKSEEADCYATLPYETARTKKVPRNHVLADATKEHPAQVQMYMEDVLVGFWQTIKFSGAIPDADRRAMLVRVRKLQDAVKVAREQANSIEVNDYEVAEPLFDYVFGQ